MIRKANYQDIEQIKALLFDLNQLHQANLRDDYKSPEEIAEKINIQEYIDDKEKIALVACLPNDKEKITGFILGDIWQRKSWILQDRRIGNIVDLIVDKNYQRQGIGKRLFEAFEIEMKALNADEIWVEIYDFNKQALAFYQRCGITPLIQVNRKIL